MDEEEDDEVTQDRNCILKWMDTGVVMETVMV